jgi:sortase A
MLTTDKATHRYLLIIRGEAKNQRRWWKIVQWVERIALTCGLGLLAIVGITTLERSIASQAALKAFTDLGSASSSSSGALDAGSSLPDDVIQRPVENTAHAHFEQVSRRNGGPIAVLQIPKIHLDAPVFNGTDTSTLNHGVGRIVGTARLGESGNIGIAGHRDTFFRGLKDLHKGDAIELKTKRGTGRYTVDEIQIVSPDNIDVLRTRTHPTLTLVTCYPFYFVGNAPQRYIVTASLTGEQSSGPGK